MNRNDENQNRENHERAKSQAWELFLKEHGEALGLAGENPSEAEKEAVREEDPLRSVLRSYREEEPVVVEQTQLEEIRIFEDPPRAKKEKKEKKEKVKKEKRAQKEADQPQLPRVEAPVLAAIEMPELEVDMYEKATKKFPWKQLGLVVLCLAILAGACFFAYTALNAKLAADRAAIDEMIAAGMLQIQEANEAALGDIDSRVDKIDAQMTEITEILASTDEAILASGAENREAMSEKIEALDKQLEDLKESLDVLLADQNR